MKTFGRIIAGILFLIFFFVFLLISTLRFELLNPSFLFFSLETNHIYEVLPSRMARAIGNDNHLSQAEKATYAKVVATISPDKMQEMIETNLLQVLHFINGESRDINIRISSSELSLPGKDLTGSLRALSPERKALAQQVQGIGQKMVMLIMGIFLILLVLLFLSGKVVLLLAGILTIILALAARFALWVVATNTPQLEPSQLLLVLLASSVFADIVFTWIIFGGLCIALWIIWKKREVIPKRKK